MLVTKVKLKNWRNFRSVDVPLRDVTYILGPNASGKSNFLDVFRFLRDISKPAGGGLQAAVIARGGISKLRCLHARRDPEVCIDVELSDSPDDEVPNWRYVLGFRPEGKGAQRILVSKEEVWHKGEELFSRPDHRDGKDTLMLTQTRLEQIATNAEFREVADFFGSITYLHLVPQLLKFADQLGGRALENDPFGQSFLEKISKITERVRNTRLKKISEALTLAVPQFKELRFVKDDSGHPHLESRYAHHRPNAGWQSEEHFSDGTLRLLGLLWAFLDGSSMLLLEEPEISLNDAVVKEIPLIIQRLQKSRKSKRQVLATTHSEALLSNPGIDGRGVILLEVTTDGSIARTLRAEEASALQAGLSVAEVMLPKTRPSSVNQLGFWE
ncbi:AAA family ATPase [Gluconobacter oxydans]|uniref:AAA family ATPase n=1 Tax=Gluconobacter oxydans TaxID=442 RepID=UPI00078106A8|nr:ATP-binding protein [Gluconobacter oxydans]KXV66569.1 chromosome segregation protein SMC [Gluconobacter oxydans]